MRRLSASSTVPFFSYPSPLLARKADYASVLAQQAGSSSCGANPRVMLKLDDSTNC